MMVMRSSISLLSLVLLPRLLGAQGVTRAAIQGTVSSQDGPPIPRAVVHVTNSTNGQRWEVVTSSTGRFVLEGVTIGGPYRIEVRALGFAPAAKAGIVLALGQRLVADFSLRPAAVELSPVTVSATADPVLNPSRTGPAEIIFAAMIAGLPNRSRDLLTLTTLSPEVGISASSGSAPTGGITIGGNNRLLNSFQADGGINHDPYTGRLPGRDILPRPVSLESVAEIQVLGAPFDVRHGGFAGGLVNAVTKSGTNAVHGSLFGYLADAALVGARADGVEVGDFRTWQYGATIGGPIVRDRAHYFLSVDLQRSVIPDPGPLITDTAGGADTARIGISYASATRFQNILRNTYGLDAGTLGPVDQRQPARDVFAKITAQVGTNSHLEVSHHYARGERRGFLTTGQRAPGQYWLSSTDRFEPSTANASRLIWTGLLGQRWSNALIVSYLRLRDACTPVVDYPFLSVTADRGILRAGTPTGCPTNAVEQDAIEVTENVTVGVGGHVVTLGAHGALLHFTDNLLGNVAGTWTFPSLDSLEAGRATQYDRAFAGPAGATGVDFGARQISLYVQDRWSPTRTLTLTLGLRLDVPFLPDPVGSNDLLKTALGIDIGRLPSGNLLWSPRLGFNYDLRGEGRTFLRGGIGLFSGPPPYSWFASAYRDEGTHELFLSCQRGNVPQFDPATQPITCANGAGPTPRFTFFDPGAPFPQTLKVALGADHQLPGGILGTVHLLYNYAVHQLYLSDANLLSPVGVARGEGNRLLYGTINSLGVATPTRRSTAFEQVTRVSSRDGDRALTLSAQLRKRFESGAELDLLYGHTRARDRMSLVNFPGAANLAHTPLEGTLEDRRLGMSYFDIPHRVQLNAVIPLPYRMRFWLRYAGASGTPYTYVVQGDANADGIPTAMLNNDPVYVPRDSQDIALVSPADWARLDAFIRSDPCLREQRGRILARNSCRQPWFGTVNARLTKAFSTAAGQSLELTADLYNVLNLINSEWGQLRLTSGGGPPVRPMLALSGYDAAVGRGLYRLQALVDRFQLQDLSSRWQVELSARYVF